MHPFCACIEGTQPEALGMIFRQIRVFFMVIDSEKLHLLIKITHHDHAKVIL